MDRSEQDQQRDAAFGRTMTLLRTRLALAQTQLAEALGVSSRTITSWETGVSYPNLTHLKHFIELAVQQHAFSSGHEREEIEQVWRQAHQRAVLDDLWLEMLLKSLLSSSLSQRQENESSTSSRGIQPPEPNVLVTTKFFIPSPFHALLTRSRLTESFLHLSLERPLTLLSAPAGFGKTSLLSSWLRLLPQGKPYAAWLSLDETDNDPVQFWHSVLSALQRQRPGAFADLLALLQEQQYSSISLSYVVTALLNELADNHYPLLLVLDDYHLITDPTVHRTLTSFIEHLAPNVHLMIATRADPPFSLARWRVQGRLVELRTEQLRWTAEETQLFLEQVLHLSLSAEQIEQVHERTEGWIVGAQLLALSLQGRERSEHLLDMLSGRQHYILDYLMDEVIHKQETAVQTFLLHTSILERFSASLCDAVVGRHASQQVLEYLERANLFVDALDTQRHWYRYHALFAEALRARLVQQGEEVVALLHHRASVWFEQHGQTSEAILHALKAKDWHRAVDLIEPIAQVQLWVWKEEMSLRRWIEQLPQEVTRSRPLLSLTYARFLFSNESPKLIEEWLESAERELRRRLSQDVAERAETESIRQSDLHDLLGTVFVLQAFTTVARGNASLALMLHQQAAAYLAEENVSTRSLFAMNQGMIHIVVGEAIVAGQKFLEAARLLQSVNLTSSATTSLSIVGRILVHRGRLREAWDIFEQVMALNQKGRSIPYTFASRACGDQIDLLREWNRLEEADALIGHAVQIAEQSRDEFSLRSIYAICASLAFIKEDYDLAASFFEKAEQIAAKIKRPLTYIIDVLSRQVRFWLAQGKMAHAMEVVEGLLQQEQLSPLAREHTEVIRVRILLALHAPEEALRLLPSLLQGAIRQERFGHVLQMYLLQARAFDMVQQEHHALDSLRAALHLAEPEGYIRTFLDEGPQMASLLNRLRNQYQSQEATSYLDRLLEAFSTERERHQTKPLPVEHQSQHPLLTKREVQILHEMAQGTPNRGIAERLVIAVTTVKRHTSHILRKLGVENRMQAVARARNLGMLTDPPFSS